MTHSAKPVRLQLSRAKGFNLQALSLATNGLAAVNVARPSKWGNPFKVGGYFMMGDPDGKSGPMGMIWCEAAPDFATDKFTKIETREQAVKWYKWLTTKYPPKDIEELRGKNLACRCPLDKLPCHADVLLELANTP